MFIILHAHTPWHDDHIVLPRVESGGIHLGPCDLDQPAIPSFALQIYGSLWSLTRMLVHVRSLLPSSSRVHMSGNAPGKGSCPGMELVVEACPQKRVQIESPISIECLGLV
jgi:hypothetical protein